METRSSDMMPRMELRKYDELLASQHLTAEQLETALDEAGRSGKHPASLLAERYHVPRPAIGNALSSFYKCPFVPFDENRVIQADLVSHLNPSYLRAQLWVPLSQKENTIHVLIDDPLAKTKIQDIQHLFPRKNIALYVGLPEDILLFISSIGKKVSPKEPEISALLQQMALEQEQPSKIVEPEPPLLETDSVVVRLANQILIDACKAGASDIHVEPYVDKDTIIRFRIDGECLIYQKIPPRYRRVLVARLKVMAGLDISERRKPQDGKLKLRVEERDVEVRIATVPTASDIEDVVMRVLASNEPVPLQNISLSEANLRDLTFLLGLPHGIILCVGPTGSGKTTTLHSALSYINGPNIKIWTAEDPVEITQYGLRQVQIQPKIGFTFAAAMRAFLRADPDVIMVGEMRDKETIEIAIQASLTGHLVLSTMHTNSAVETVSRLLDVGMDPFGFSDALQGILAQRLVRRICPLCREKYHPDRGAFDELAKRYGAAAFKELGVSYDENFVLYRGAGCAHCLNSGYKGRIAIHELLLATAEIKRLVQGRACTAEIQKGATAAGMRTLLQDGIVKCLRGDTDFAQVQAAT